MLTRNPAAPRSPLLPPEIAELGAQVLQAQQTELARLSSNSAHVIAAQAGHNIHVQEPQLIVEAIERLLDAADSAGQ